MKMTQDLVVCALKRAMEPITAEVALLRSMALAESVGVPTRVVAGWTVKQAAALLVHATKERRVVQDSLGTGVATVTWRPIDGYDPDAEIPDPQSAKVEQHLLEEMTPAQALVLFDVTTDMLHECQAKIVEVCRQQAAVAEWFTDLQRRAGRRLAAAGLADRVPEHLR
jgi:hypothetical protein